MDKISYFDLLVGRHDFCLSRCSEVFQNYAESTHGHVSQGVSQNSFAMLCKHLLGASADESEFLLEDLVFRAFEIFDRDKDKFLNPEEFRDCWSNWIVQILCPKTCLLLVDMQNDFIDGSLALKNCPAKQDGNDAISVVNKLTDTCGFDMFVYSMDWHPWNHCSFIDNVKSVALHAESPVAADEARVFDTVLLDDHPPLQQQLFPAHCIQGSVGAMLHKDLKIQPGCTIIKKGTDHRIDSFSAFMDNAKKNKTELDSLLFRSAITDVYVCGLATDYCVGNTALDALDLGYRTVVIEDACRGCYEERMIDMRRRIHEKGGVFVNSWQVSSILLGYHRPPGLAMHGLSKTVLERTRRLNVHR